MGGKDETMSFTFYTLSVFVATLRTCFYFSGGFEGGGKVLVYVFLHENSFRIFFFFSATRVTL